MKIEKIVTGPLAENCYIVANENNCVIIDPGDWANRIDEAISDLCVKPIAILLTHGHFDHVGAVKALKNKYNIPVYMSENDKFLTKEKFNVDFDASLCEKIDGFNIKTVNTPGHTPGSCCYVFDDIVFSGDTLFKLSVGRWDFEGGSLEELKKSLSYIKNVFLSDYTIYPGHGEETTMEFELKNNKFFNF